VSAAAVAMRTLKVRRDRRPTNRGAPCGMSAEKAEKGVFKGKADYLFLSGLVVCTAEKAEKAEKGSGARARRSRV